MNDAPPSKAYRYKCSNSFEISASNLIRLSEGVTVVILTLPFETVNIFYQFKFLIWHQWTSLGIARYTNIVTCYNGRILQITAYCANVYISPLNDYNNK